MLDHRRTLAVLLCLVLITVGAPGNLLAAVFGAPDESGSLYVEIGGDLFFVTLEQQLDGERNAGSVAISIKKAIVPGATPGGGCRLPIF